MRDMNKNLNKGRLSMLAGGVVALLLSACYDKFDPESYQPVFTISGYASTDEIAPENLVAYWSFDDGLTETVSGTEATNHEATVVNGFKGQGVSFNANSPSYLISETPASVTAVESFTVSLWVNPTFVDSDGNNLNDGILGFMSISNPARFWGNFEWFIENNSNPDTADIKIILTHDSMTETDIMVHNFKDLFGNWTNHTVTYDAATSTLSYYINGSRLATKTTPWMGPMIFSGSGPM